jgi:putative nucleotidyltransferase with HDIG domain
VGLARAFGLGDGVAAALGEIYERWDGRGAPHHRKGDGISLAARVVHVAGVVEVLHRVAGPRAAVDAVRARIGRALDPAVSDAFLSSAAEVLARVESPSVWDDYLGCEPEPGLSLDPAQLDDAALSFARYVDLKCPFTLGHSTGVAALAAAAAGELGLDADACARLRRAGWLHDLGRVSVPNGIWEKPGALNASERDRVEQHARHGERILSRCPALADIAAVVGRHHERVDGSGYPRGVGGAAMDASARVLAAADVMQAVGAERPWRAARSPSEVAQVMRDEVAAGRLDAEAVRAVMRAAGMRDPRVRAALPMGLSEREVEVLRLLARGMTNPAIGRRLFISPRTVQQHVRNLYAKAGVSTRAAAALFATTHDLA